jgi:hypothetical protein
MPASPCPPNSTDGLIQLVDLLIAYVKETQQTTRYTMRALRFRGQLEELKRMLQERERSGSTST